MNNPLRHALQALQLATVYKILTDTKITESDGFYGHVFEFSLDTSDALPLIWSEWHVLHWLIVRGNSVWQLVRLPTWFAYLLSIKLDSAIRKSRRLTTIK